MSGPTKAQYLAAASLIEERGWIQDVGYGPREQVCIVSGLYLVRGKMMGDREAYWDLVSFNDAPGRTKAEVLSALLGLAEVAP